MGRRDSPPPSSTFAALRIPHVGAFSLGRAASTFGTQLVSVAVGWELYERTGDAWALGLVGLVQAAPTLALTLPAGEAADRFSRRTVAILSHALLALVALGLAVVSWSGASVELFYGLLLLGGAGRAFSMPAGNALLVQLLSRSQFASANAWVVLTTQLALIAGPAAGGLLIALAGAAAPAYLAALAGQLLAVGTLARLPAVPRPARPTLPEPGGLFAGVVFIKRSPVFLAAITLDLFAVLLGGAVALMPLFAKDILGVGPAGLGLLRSAPSLGAVLAAFVTTRLATSQRPGLTLLLTVAGFGIATVGFGLSRDLGLSLVCLVLTGAFNTISVVIRRTLQQVITPDRLQGRIAAISSLFTGLSNELGAFKSGATAALFGPVISVVGGGLGTIVGVALVALAWPALARVGPLHTLKPSEADITQADEPTAQPEPRPA